MIRNRWIPAALATFMMVSQPLLAAPPGGGARPGGSGAGPRPGGMPGGGPRPSMGMPGGGPRPSMGMPSGGPRPSMGMPSGGPRPITTVPGGVRPPMTAGGMPGTIRPPTAGIGANPAGSRATTGNLPYYYGGPRPPIAGSAGAPGGIRPPVAGVGGNPGGIRNVGSSPYFYYGGRPPGWGPGGAPGGNPYTWSRPRPPGGFPPGGNPGWGGGWNGGWGYSPYWNKAFYRPSWCPWYTGYPWGSIALGFAIGWLSSPAWGFGGYYAGSPYFGSAVAPATSFVVVQDASPAAAVAEPPATPPPADAPSGPQARITVRLPNPDAKLWINEYVSTLTGPERVLITPPLEPGKSYSYTLTVEWVENGQPKSRTRVIKFDPGDVLTVNFNHADGE